MMTTASVLNAVLLGIALAMDAFSVSIANALHEPQMRRAKKGAIAGTFAFFQFFMPVTGWFCVHSILEAFTAFQVFIPWIGFFLLLIIGGKMLLEGISTERAAAQANAHKPETPAAQSATHKPETPAAQTAADDPAYSPAQTAVHDLEAAISGTARLGAPALLLQGIATSIDALSTGFAFAEYSAMQTFLSALIIAAVTFLICTTGLEIGAKLGRPESGKSSIAGGVILIAIGIELLIKGI